LALSAPPPRLSPAPCQHPPKFRKAAPRQANRPRSACHARSKPRQALANAPPRLAIDAPAVAVAWPAFRRLALICGLGGLCLKRPWSLGLSDGSAWCCPFEKVSRIGALRAFGPHSGSAPPPKNHPAPGG
jgi:hypothetical protein